MADHIEDIEDADADDRDEFREGPTRPYIVFERTMNKNHKKRKQDTSSGVVLQTAARKEKWKCFLADNNGELHPWATLSGIQRYISKGYIPLEFGDFDGYLARKKPNQDMVLELLTLRQMLTRTVDDAQALEQLRAGKAAAEKERQELLAKFEAQSKELEELKKTAAAQRKQEDKAAKSGGAGNG